MEAYIVAGYRSAIGKAKRGGFKNYRTDDLAVDVIKHLTSQVPELDTTKVDDVIVGCANPEGEQGLQVARLISARALGKEVPGVTINRYCASGLEAISMAVSKVRAGFGHIFVAGGIESMSLIPMTGYKLSPSYKANMENMNYHIGMGHTAEAVAEKYKISREASDQFSYESHQKAANAIEKGLFKDEIVPVTVEEVFVQDGNKVSKSHTVDMDEGVRRETTVEALAKLRPAFKLGGIVTAGSSSQMSDGAAFVLVMSEEMVKQLGVKPIARMVTCTSGGVDPLYMGIGPVEAIPKALSQAGLKLSDIEQTELNEAFACQALAVIQESGLNPDTVNVNGGAIALGHPIGASGTRILVTLIHEMIKRDSKKGIATLCIGGGMGIAMCIERNF